MYSALACITILEHQDLQLSALQGSYDCIFNIIQCFKDMEQPNNPLASCIPTNDNTLLDLHDGPHHHYGPVVDGSDSNGDSD